MHVPEGLRLIDLDLIKLTAQVRVSPLQPLDAARWQCRAGDHVACVDDKCSAQPTLWSLLVWLHCVTPAVWQAYLLWLCGGGLRYRH